VKISVQPPAETAAEHDSPVLALTLTIPVGDTPPDTPATVTATLTGLPGVDGFGEVEVMVVVAGARFTIRVTFLDTLA